MVLKGAHPATAGGGDLVVSQEQREIKQRERGFIERDWPPPTQRKNFHDFYGSSRSRVAAGWKTTPL